MDENTIKENPYSNSHGPIDTKKIFAALHGEALRYTILCLITGSEPDYEYKKLYDTGLAEIKKDPEKALKFENKIKSLYELNNASSIETIIESNKDSDTHLDINNSENNHVSKK